MNIDLDRILETGAKVVDSAKRTASGLAKEGARQADLLAAQNKLAKAQRQLGMLVYDLAKNGEENPQLVQKYIASIAALESEISDLKGARQQEPAATLRKPAQYATVKPEQPAEPAHPARTCPQCGAEVKEDAVFCSGCGAQL